MGEERSGGGVMGEIAKGAVGALAEVATTAGKRRRLNAPGFVLLCASLLVSGYLCYGKLQDARTWKGAVEARLLRIETKVDALLIMRGVDPSRIASAAASVQVVPAAPSPTPAVSLSLIPGAEAAEKQP